MADDRILTQCLRCKEPYWLKPGLNLTDFCPTCRRQVGRRMDPARQHQMNSNWEFERQMAAKHHGPKQPFIFLKDK